MAIPRKELLNSPEDALRAAMDGRQVRIWTAMPALVSKVDLTKMTISAQPVIQGLVNNPDGSSTYVNLPQLGDVPICFPSAGGFTLTMPISVGDEVLIIIASRCIDAWWQNGCTLPTTPQGTGLAVPVELRMHDLSDGFAIPGPKSLPHVIGSISSTDAQLRNNAGTTYLSIAGDGSIKLMSSVGIHVTGNLSVTGTISATAEITAMGTIPLSTHLHGGVTSGINDTGVPIP